MGYYRKTNEKVKLDPILGTPIKKNENYQKQFQPKAKVKQKATGLGSTDHLTKILDDHKAKNGKANIANKYKKHGIDISNRTGDTIGRIYDVLTAQM